MTTSWIKTVTNFPEIRQFIVPDSESMRLCSLLRVTVWEVMIDVYVDGIVFAIPERWRSKGFERPILKLSFCESSSFKASYSPLRLQKVCAQLLGPTKFAVTPADLDSADPPLIEIQFGSLLAKVMADPAELTRELEPSGFARDLEK